MELSGARDGHSDPGEGGSAVRDVAWQVFVPSLDRPTIGHRDIFLPSEKSPSAVMAAPMALGRVLSPDVGPRPGDGRRVAGCYLGVSDQESWAAASEGGYNVLKTTGIPNRRSTPPVQRTSPSSPARGATPALLHHCSQPRGRVGRQACRARGWETT